MPRVDEHLVEGLLLTLCFLAATALFVVVAANRLADHHLDYWGVFFGLLSARMIPVAIRGNF